MKHLGGARELVLLGLAAVLLFLGYGWPQLTVPAFTPEPRPEGVLRVVTWNVASGGEGKGAGLRDEHLSHVATVLAELDPDLCFLQGVGGEAQLAALRDALGEDWSAVVFADAGEPRVAALAQRGVLTRVPGELDLRRGILVRYAPRAGRTVLAAGIHADARAARQRNEEIGTAVHELFARGEDAVLVLAGDLNLDVDLEDRRSLVPDGDHFDVETYGFVVDRLVDVACGCGATAAPDRRLDYVFADPRAFRSGPAGPVRGRRVGGIEHDPVLADLAPR